MSWIALAVAIGLPFGPSGAASPAAPAFGISVTPPNSEISDRERSDPVARHCATVARAIAAQLHGELGDESLSVETAEGPTWRARLLISPEPPLILQLTCTRTRFDVGGSSFDPASPPRGLR